MHILRTIIPMLVMPTTVGLLLILAGLLLKRRKWLIWTGFGILWIASMPVASDTLMRAVEGYRARQAIGATPSADAVVVLSWGVRAVPGDSGALEFGEFDRFLGGFDLFHASKAPQLIFTGGWSEWSPDTPLMGDVLVERARSFGVPESALSTTSKVSNTEQEAAAVAALLHATPATGAALRVETPAPPSVLLVTSAYHMRRAEKLFRAAGLSVIPFPVDFQTPPANSITLRSFIPSGGAMQQSELALHEILGSIYYWITG